MHATPPSKDATTRTLQAAAGGNRQAVDRLMPVLYRELQTLARRQLGSERAGHTLDSVALVSEAYLKLIRGDAVTWRDHSHFVALCGRAVRQVLADYARKHNAARRGNRFRRELPHLDPPGGPIPIDIVAFDDLLAHLEKVDEDALTVIELYVFSGFTFRGISEHTGWTPHKIKQKWVFARRLLLQGLGLLPAQPQPSEPPQA